MSETERNTNKSSKCRMQSKVQHSFAYPSYDCLLIDLATRLAETMVNKEMLRNEQVFRLPNRVVNLTNHM